ncbi:hypothetical protein MATL_G00098320 [Megalops atlanticus]|uniref:Golgin subfamily B member 1 n=1 Tax=Megalops atlanticus TaxID=7932 RepID=A0A9D3Q5X3_MEGAT|nr:hypothetical protein MATL_G00098320 [Megalops atlanticus]
MDAMLVEKDKKLAEKEAYIIDLQMSTAVDNSTRAHPHLAEEQKVHLTKEETSPQDLQLLVQNLTKKVGDSEEKYSLLLEQTESLKDLLVKEKAQFEEKENMYKQNIQTFKDIMLQKDNKLIEINQKHEQELFKLAAKSDASADLEQLLKALKQKLHEKEEVLLGKTQVIDVLQGEVDGRDQQIKELVEKIKRLQSEKDNMQSKLDAEKHVMRAQLRDLMQKHEMELQKVAEKHEIELSEKEQQYHKRLEELQRTQVSPQEEQGSKITTADAPTDKATNQRLSELEVQVKLKAEEASKSEAKFLKMKAWSKSRIKQLEDELRKAQSGNSSPDVNALRTKISDLEEERAEMLYKLDQYDELKAKNDQLAAKLVVYEEQQRKMQADLEQVTKRAASQTSESGSADDLQSQVLEWQEMVAEAESARDQAREEKAAMALRMSHIEEEREALASRQQELEEELAQARGLRQPRGKKPGEPAARSLQEDFEFDGKQSYQDPKCTLESTTSMDGENMGGLRSVVEELELERNQLQEQILGLEERCQDLEDRLQLQARIESLQNETERLQGQLASLRNQQSRDAEKHQLLVTSLNEQLKGLSETQECLETSLMEKEHILAKTSEKLELIDSMRDSLKEKEVQHKEVAEKLLQTEHSLSEVTKKCNTYEKQCSEMKISVTDLTQKLSIMKEKTQKQESTIELLQSELEQTNDELDKLNSTHLEERAQLIHDLQTCEREIDNLKDVLSDKDKEISALTSNMTEYTEQILELKHEIKGKEEALVHTETALAKAEQKAQIIRDSQSSDQQALNSKIADLVEQLKTTECKLSEAKEQKDLKIREVEELMRQVQEDSKTIQSLRGEIHKLNLNHRNHLSECESQISSLKGQVAVLSQKLQESEHFLSQLKETNATNAKLQDQLQDKEQMYEKELKSFKEERNNLLAEVSKHNKELQALSKKLEEQVEGQEEVKKVVQEKMEIISLLEQKLNVTQEEAEGERLKLNQELKIRESDNERLQKDLQIKCEKISELEISVKTLESANQQLQAIVETNAKELEAQKQLVGDLSEKATVALEQNADLLAQVAKLTEESQKLRQKVTEGKRSQAELIEENNIIQSKISAFEMQHSENCKTIEGLLKEKEELSLRNDELCKVLKENTSTISESLLEKNNECSHLTKLLCESKESIDNLQEQVNNLNSQVDQLKLCMAEKEKMVEDQNAHCELQESQLRQLKETLSLLQEQSAALKSGLMEKDTALQQKTAECNSLQREILQQREIFTQLQSETESLRTECTRLSQSLEEKEMTLRNKAQECQNYFDELNKSNESVVSLHSHLGVVNENSLKLESEVDDLKASLENLITVNKKLTEEVNYRQNEVMSLQNHIQVLSEENQQLQGSIESKEKEVVEQKMLVADFGKKTGATLEENANLQARVTELTEMIRTLQQEVTEKDKSQSELVEERSKLQSKLSAYDMQHSENRKIIGELLKEKEELTIRNEELKDVFEQNKSISENLLAKTNECSNFIKSLAESDKTVTHSQEQISFLNTQIDQLNCSVAEKDKMIIDQKALHEMQQSQLIQLQETLSLLQEQSAALKSGLVEKDATLQQKTAEYTSLQNETLQQREFLSQLQTETESLRTECTTLSQRLEEKETAFRNKTKECQNYLDELNKSSESMVSLCSQFDVMKASLENQTAGNKKLIEEVAQRETEVVDLKKHIQVLNEENSKIKTEHQNLAAELSQKQNEISLLQSELSSKNNSIVSLTEQLATFNVERQKLYMTLQQKTESMNWQETFIKQLQDKSVEGKDQLNQTMGTVIELQTQIQTMQKSLQDKEISLKNKEEELKQFKDKSVMESEALKAQVHTNTQIIDNLQGQIKRMIEEKDQLSMEITDKESHLQQKVDDCERLRAQVSELEGSAMNLRNQVEALTSESIQMTEMLKEKDQAVLDIKNSSRVHSRDLNVKFKAKEAECESLKEQLSELNESISKLKDNLSAQSSEIVKLKEVLEEKEVGVLEKTKALQDLQGKADEAALFKAQFMESTELVSQLQGQFQELTLEYKRLSMSSEEKQSAFTNLQEKYTANLEEFHEVKMLLSQRNEEVTSLNKALSDSNDALNTAESTIAALRNEATLLQEKLQWIQASNTQLLKQKEDALTSHEANTTSLNVEIEKLKSQHLQVAAQVNALTENLEQRELALHAINNQYSAQVKHAEYLVSEMQKLDEKNRKLREESSLAAQHFQQQLDVSISEKEHLQQELKETISEKEELVKSYGRQLQNLQEELHLQSQHHFSSMNEAVEKMKTEKEHLQVQVSVKEEEISGLKLEIQKIAQTLQESEKEWLSILDREKCDRNLLAEQLKSVENEMKSKDVKVQALGQDLDHLQERYVEVTSALKVSSEQMKEKDLEAVELSQQISANRNKLEEALLAIQTKEAENLQLRQTLKERENEIRNLELKKRTNDADFTEFSQTTPDRVVALEGENLSLHTTIKQLNANHQSEVDSLRKELHEAVHCLHQKQNKLLDRDKEYEVEKQQVCLLQEQVRCLQGEVQVGTESMREADINRSSLLCEIEKREDQINCMNIQIGQQKELIATLSQQLREKDVAVTQVMVSASNEMVKHTEEKNHLLSQIESLENAQRCSIKKLENISLQLEESKTQLSHYQCQIETKEFENITLVKENEHLKIQQEQLSKEKDLVKKKLQAALIVRKDLLKKIEEYEKHIGESEKNVLEVSGLHDKVQELTLQAENTAKDHEAYIERLKQQIAQKEGEIQEFSQAISGKEILVEQLQNNIEHLQTQINVLEVNLATTLHSLKEKCELIDHLEVSITEKEVVFDREHCEMTMKLDQLKKELTEREESFNMERVTALATSSDTENELTKVKQEKSVLQKKIHAALLYRKETMKKLQENERKHVLELSELKEDLNKLLQQQSQQTNEMNVFQVKYDEKVKELQDEQQVVASLQDELNTVRKCIEEKEKALNDLSISFAEKESQAQTTSKNEEELEALHSKLVNMTDDMANKDALLIALRQSSEEYAKKVEQLESELEKACAEIREKSEEVLCQQREVRMAQQLYQQEKQEHIEQQKQLQKSQALIDELKLEVEAVERGKGHQLEDLREMNRTLLEANSQIKEELKNSLSVISQKSLELETIQNTLTESQQQFCHERDCLKMEVEESQRSLREFQAQVESYDLNIKTLQKEKETMHTVVEKYKDEVSLLETKLADSEKLKEDLLQKVSVIQEEKLEQGSLTGTKDLRSLKSYTEELEARLRERDHSIRHKEELIAALEQQLQKKIHLHEVALEKIQTRVDELQQRSTDVTEGSKTKEHSNENKSIEQITRKLQAALISRKEALKENRSLKEQIQTLSSEKEEISNVSLSFERSVKELKQHKEDLEKCLLSLSKEKEELISEVDRILSDNHNLSAACESLKLTIENITQQKQAFSCQLESLKDSQTVELSEWKSKHTELKQEYESLLQAYENVSCEMDKMRQLLEAARKEKQEALLKVLQTEMEKESLQKQLSQVEEENDKIKEKMQKFAKAKQQKIRELEEENEKIRKDLFEFDEKQRCSVDELTLRNTQLETEICRLKESSEELRVKLKEIQQDNYNLAEELKTTSSSLEKWHSKSKATEMDLQLKLDEALTLNDSLTADSEAQKAEIVAKLEMIELMQKENLNLSEQLIQLKKDYEVKLDEKDRAVAELQEVTNKNLQENISLNEKVRILEDDKTLLQEELENVQETSDKVKNENEYLETLLLKNSERIDELTEVVKGLQSQNTQLSVQLTESKEEKANLCKEKEDQQLKLVKAFEEKLKVAQRGSDGSKNVKKELQELLKEKHQEINQLQHDCIKYQELILDLERSLKLSQSEREQLEGELKEMIEKNSDVQNRMEHLEAELESYKRQLSEASQELVNMNAENNKLKEEIAGKVKHNELQMLEQDKALKRVSEQQMVLHEGKLADLQNQITQLQGLKDRNSEVVMELKRQIDSQDLQIKTLKRESETNLTKLAALSVSPQSGDVTKHWDDVFQKVLQEKDSQLLEQSYVIMRLLEDVRGKENLVNDLQLTNSRQERSLNEYTVAATAQQRQLFVLGVSNTELSQNVETLNRQIKEQSILMEKLEHDKHSLTVQLTDKSDSVLEKQSALVQVERKLSDTESQLLLTQSQHDKLHVELQKQEAITLQLKLLLQNKDSEISLLLSSRNGQMSEYLEQLQVHHRAQITSYEDRLSALYTEKEKVDKAFRGLESKVRKLQMKMERLVQEKEQMAAKTETLKNTMTSLQAERDQLVSRCRVLEAQHQSIARDKDSLVKDDFSASKGLKQEIKILLHQMDDLNSENAMLKAQLIRYREDLNQVLSLKDNQLKELLRKQQDSIKNLENQKAALEKQCQEAQFNLQKEMENNSTLKTQNSKLGTQVQELEANMLALRKEKSEMNESKVISDLQQAVAAKAAECNNLQQKLFAQKMAADDMKRSMQQLESEAEKKLGEAEDKYNSELNAFEREVDLMRSEREMAEERVEELAKELMQTEQMLSNALRESKDMKCQNESLGKAMAALQNDRDQLIEDFKVLRNRYDEELRETTAAMRKVEHQLSDSTTELSSLNKERYILIQKLSAFESSDTHSQLLDQIDELCKTISEKDVELKRLLHENDTYSKQVMAFSRSMASLQDDRDRLIQELAEAKHVCEARQGASPTADVPVKNVELSSHRNNSDALQNEKDRLQKEAGSLRPENTELAQLKLRLDQKTEVDVNKYETELVKLRTEKDQLQSQYCTLREQHLAVVAEREHQLGELQRLRSEIQLKEAKGTQAIYPAKETVALVGKDASAEQLSLLLAERGQLQSDLQRCLQEIHQRDVRFQQLNAKLLQTVEEKMGVSSQLKAVSQTLRETQLSLGELQNHCYWLESQVQSRPGQPYQGQVQGPVTVEVPPGAPQERSSAVVDIEGLNAQELRSRLAEVEQQLDSIQQEKSQLTESLVEERARREAAEEALGVAEEKVKSFDSISRVSPREFSIQLESDDEREALIINPNEHVVMRKVKGGALACRRWLRGRSLYCSKMLTSRAKSRYLFLTYLLLLHVVVFMCLTGTL